MAITINRQRWDVNGSYREILYDFDCTAVAEVFPTPLHLIEHASVQDTIGIQNMAFVGGTILMTVVAPPHFGVKLRVIGV